MIFIRYASQRHRRSSPVFIFILLASTSFRDRDKKKDCVPSRLTTIGKRVFHYKLAGPVTLVLHVEIASVFSSKRNHVTSWSLVRGEPRGRLGDAALVGAGDAGQAHDALVCLVQLPLRQKGVDGRARADVPGTGDQHLPLALRALVRAMVVLRRHRLVHSTAASHGPLVRVMHGAQKALSSAVRRWTFYVREKKRLFSQ